MFGEKTSLEELTPEEKIEDLNYLLRLAPNNKVSGGKLLSSKVPKGSKRLKIALRNAANAIGNLKIQHL